MGHQAAQAAGAPADADGPRGIDEVPDELRDLLAACVDLDPAARPRLVDIRAVLTPLAGS